MHKGILIIQCQVIQKASLHLVKLPQLDMACNEEGAIVVLRLAPNMSLVLVKQVCNRENMFEFHYGTDLGA